MKLIEKFLKSIDKNAFPNDFTCDICGIETFGGNLCPDCLKTVSFNDGDVCPVCGRRTLRPEICMECKAAAPAFLKAVSPLVYADGTVILISKFKNGCGYLKDYFSDLIAAKIGELGGLDCIVYVPMTDKAIKKRGYNQAELLARGVSERTDIPVIKNALVKTRDTKDQKSLSQKERSVNLQGCFQVKERAAVKGKRVLLIDDVLTTGATSETLSKKLLKAGAASVCLATVASVEYRPYDADKLSENL